VYKTFDCAGALIWSLRGHSDKSGFDTHSEGNNIYSYHAPGWINQTSKSFDTQESSVIAETYNARYSSLWILVFFLFWEVPWMSWRWIHLSIVQKVIISWDSNHHQNPFQGRLRRFLWPMELMLACHGGGPHGLSVTRYSAWVHSSHDFCYSTWARKWKC
jgi:hypothetical protein